MPIDPKYLEGRPSTMPFTVWVQTELERRDKLIADLEAERDSLREYAAKIGAAHVEEETLRNAQIAKLTTALEMWSAEHPPVYRVWSESIGGGLGQGGAGNLPCDCKKCVAMREALKEAKANA